MSNIANALRKRLAEFDGKAVTLLGETEAALSGEAGYCDALIALAPDEDDHVSDGATWLIKSALENGAHLSKAQTAAYCAAFPKLASWGAQLHACQSLQFMAVLKATAADVAAWLEPLLTHQRPFVRAWALDGLYRLAQQHSEHRAAFEQALVTAQQDDAASVRARARRLSMIVEMERVRKEGPVITHG